MAGVGQTEMVGVGNNGTVLVDATMNKADRLGEDSTVIKSSGILMVDKAIISIREQEMHSGKPFDMAMLTNVTATTPPTPASETEAANQTSTVVTQFNGLSGAMLDMINQAAIHAVQNNDYPSRDVMPNLYKDIELDFEIWDMNFTGILNFLNQLTTTALAFLAQNDNLFIHLCFTDDVVAPYMMDDLYEWLEACVRIPRRISTAASALRIPWLYMANAEDMFAHIDAEVEVARWGELPADIADEWELLKEEFHDAPDRIA